MIPIFTESGTACLQLWNNQMETGKRTQSGPETSSPHQCYPVVLQEAPLQHRRAETNQSQPVSPAQPCPLCFSLCPLFYPPHHFTTPSLPTSLSLWPSPPISGHVGLLFMASPIEDALLYKTLEPSSRPTPFEDVAHNSYLGL